MSRSLQPSSSSSQRFAGRSTLVASAIVGLGVASDNVASASEFFRHLPPGGLGAIREQGGLTYAEEALVADFVFRPAAIAREIAWLGRDRSLGAGLRRVGAAHAPDVRHILRLPTDDREVLRAEQQSLATVNEELESLLDSLDLPMVIVDAERCVRRFTSSARRMVNVNASDIGRPSGDIRWNVSVAMRERVDQLGGEFDIHFTDHGTIVQVRVPPQECNR